MRTDLQCVIEGKMVDINMSVQRRFVRYLVPLILTSSGILLEAQQPLPTQLTAIEPRTGVTTPGIKVTVYGTAFSQDAIVYFDGLQARETSFIGPSTLQVVTPYLRPGPHQVQLKSGESTIRSGVTFVASPSPIDSQIDSAIAMADHGESAPAVAILKNIAKENPDHQVRAFAHYQSAEIYFALGDWWHWAGEAGAIFDHSGEMAVQTSWRYRLASDESTYLLPVENDPDTPLRLAEWTVKYDVTENPEPRFFRALLNARQGNLEKAKNDCAFILAQDPQNSSYRALAAYISALEGKKMESQSFAGGKIHDARALGLLGQAAFIGGEREAAKTWWQLEAKEDPHGASLAYWAGKKHFARGQNRVAAALLTECITIAPNGDQAKEAKDLLAKLP
jgi:tetratricopeptide (TPR) repeat protein